MGIGISRRIKIKVTCIFIIIQILSMGPTLAEDTSDGLEITAALSTNPVIVGTLVEVSGFVRYSNFTAVKHADVTIQGTHISTKSGTADKDGRFEIAFQAPILVIDSLILTIIAHDPLTDVTSSMNITYDVIPPRGTDPPPPPPPPIGWMIVILISTVSGALAIAFFLGRRFDERR
jgi:hypothetical protein